MKKRLMILTALAVVMIVSGATVYAKTRTSVNNTVKTGAVQIALDLNGERQGTVLPGQLLDVSPVITNKGYDCYIRTMYRTDILQEYLSAQNIPDGWVKNDADGYWYYTDIVRNGEMLPVFDGLLADPMLPQEEQEKVIRFKVKAEAVQTQNFIPDFSGKDPWKGVEPEIFAGSEINTSGMFGTKGLSVVCSSDAKNLIAEPDDFFSNLPDLMPGDAFEQTIRLKNDSKEEESLYFFTEAKEGKELLSKIYLEIRSETETLYSGDLASADLEGEKKAVLLADIPAKGTKTCTFSISVPQSLKNEYAQKDCSFVWNFLTQDKQLTGNTPSPKPTTTGEPTVRPVGKSVPTGDTARAGIYLMISGASVLLLIMILMGTVTQKKRRGSADDKHH